MPPTVERCSVFRNRAMLRVCVCVRLRGRTDWKTLQREPHKLLRLIRDRLSLEHVGSVDSTLHCDSIPLCCRVLTMVERNHPHTRASAA